MDREALAKKWACRARRWRSASSTGWRFADSVSALRMHLAQRLLQDSTLAVSEIAGRVGYDSDAAFNRAFRRLVGRRQRLAASRDFSPGTNRTERTQ